MSLSPLKTAGSSSYRRRNSFSWITLVMVAVGLAAAFFAWRAFFGSASAVKKGVKALTAGQVELAEARFQALVAKDPTYAPATDGLGLVAAWKGDTATAQSLYGKAKGLGLDSGSPIDHAQTGGLLVARGAYRGALLEFQHALDLDPKSIAARKGQAMCLHATGDFQGAVAAWQALLADYPKDADVKKGFERASLAKERGTLYFIFDRNNQPLARRSLRPGGGWESSYPLEQFAAHTVGYETPDAGKAGLEKALDGLFPGNEVVLTLDTKVQRLADKAMGWKKGAMVVIDPATGEILAAVNHPSFNPNKLGEEYKKIRTNKNEPLKDRCLGSLYEPGSIVKIITAAAALESHIDMNEVFPVNADKPIVLDGREFWDWKRLGKVRSLKEALDMSSNIAMAKVGFALGADRMYEWTNRFGFGQPEELGITMPDGRRLDYGAATSLAPLPADNRFALAERACGLGEDYRITPLRAAMLAAAVANKGRLMKPMLIREVRNINGEVIATNTPKEFRQVMKPETAIKLSEYMIDTTERGIGRKARVTGIKVAGKTGTARSSKKQKELDAWFICYAPADKPQYAVAVLAEKEGKGMDVAAPIARNLLSELIQ